MISKTEISVPLRTYVASRSAHPFFSWLSRLLSCPYCTGTWLSIAAVAIYRPYAVHLFAPLDFLVTVFLVNGAAMLPVLVIRKALGK